VQIPPNAERALACLGQTVVSVDDSRRLKICFVKVIISIAIDADVKAALEFMERNVAADKLVRTN
jgi:hypothetical protein